MSCGIHFYASTICEYDISKASEEDFQTKKIRINFKKPNLCYLERLGVCPEQSGAIVAAPGAIDYSVTHVHLNDFKIISIGTPVKTDIVVN